MNVASLMNRPPQRARAPRHLELLRVQASVLTLYALGSAHARLRQVEQACRSMLGAKRTVVHLGTTPRA
jgi:hypothetical protein